MLFVTDLKLRRSFEASPADVALETNFHTVVIPGQPPDELEKLLGAEFETELGPALRLIVDARSLADEQDSGFLFYFMALLTIKILGCVRASGSSWATPPKCR